MFYKVIGWIITQDQTNKLMELLQKYDCCENISEQDISFENLLLADNLEKNFNINLFDMFGDIIIGLDVEEKSLTDIKNKITQIEMYCENEKHICYSLKKMFDEPRLIVQYVSNDF